MRILLMGNPNVGKSVIFSRLTGLRVIASNYPGTTVSFTEGRIKLPLTTATVIDVPGTYTLDPTSEAEQVAAQMLGTGDVIINVLDATNLERNLYLTLQLLEAKIPMVIALNMWDDTKHRGISIDLDKLREILKVPVIPTVAVTGEGILQLVDALSTAMASDTPVRTRDQRWIAIGEIIDNVQQITHRHHTWRDRLADASINPLTGIPIAILSLATCFYFIRIVGEGLVQYLFDPLFQHAWMPLLLRLSTILGGTGGWHDVLVGKLISGQVDFMQSFGLLSSGLYVPFAMVLPYVAAFYLMLGLLEDIGYLPRLAVLMDVAMHRIGLHGFAIIPTLLGLGCNVPGIMATRILESRKQRFIAATLISIAIPCAALQAMIISVVGQHGGQYVAIVYGTLFIAWLIAGAIMRSTVKGFAPELLIEIPPYRAPQWQAVMHKLWMRMSGFLLEAIPVIMAAVLLINVAYSMGILDRLARIAAPVVTGLWGLPKESVTAIIIGFLRKDMAVGMLAPLALTAKQATVAGVVLAMFFPCVATFGVLLKELGARDMIKSTAIMLIAATMAGALVQLIL